MKQALKKLSETKSAAENHGANDPKTRAGWEMRRRQAQAELPAIRAQFALEFKKVGFPIFLTGPGTDAFKAIAGEEAEVVVVDGVLGDLRAAVKANVNRNGEFAVSAFTAMLRELRQVAADMGLTSIPAPEFRGEEVVKNDAALDSIVTRYIQNSVGPDFIASLIELQACRGAEGLTGDQPVVPVLITKVDPALAQNISSRVFGKPAIFVDAPKEVTTEFVLEQFGAIKSALRAKTEVSDEAPETDTTDPEQPKTTKKSKKQQTQQ